MKISSASNPSTGNDQAAAQMKTMNVMMPLMSIWICFIMPAAMGIYWIGNSIFGMIRDFILTKYYKKKLDAEDAERAVERAAREAEMEAKRLEYERLKAEGKTQVQEYICMDELEGYLSIPQLRAEGEKLLCYQPENTKVWDEAYEEFKKYIVG